MRPRQPRPRRPSARLGDERRQGQANADQEIESAEQSGMRAVPCDTNESVKGPWCRAFPVTSSRLPRRFLSPSPSLPLAIPVAFPRLPLAFPCRMPRRPRPLCVHVLRTVRNVACGPVLGDGVWVLERVVLRRVRLRTRRPCGQETAARGSEAGPFSRAKAALESARNGASSNARLQGALRTQRVPQAPPPPPLEPLLPLRAPPLVLPSPPSSFPKVGKSDTSSA